MELWSCGVVGILMYVVVYLWRCGVVELWSCVVVLLLIHVVVKLVSC